ncbi:MAG TPA: hypothetical protein VIU61_20955 [Kofleriaceae bacterium]
MKKMIATSLFVMASGCVTDEGELDEDLGTTEQEVTGWLSGSFTSETSLTGWNTNKDVATSTCVLSQVAGDLGEGGQFSVADIRSAAWIRPNSSNKWEVLGHGGAYTNQTNDRVWANNVVTAGAVCVNYPKVSVSNSIWNTGDGPRKLANAASKRFCFLQGIAGGGQIFTHTDDYVRVKNWTTTDATHPTTGWYVEGNLGFSPIGQKASATAACIDFPTVTNEWTSGLESAGTHTLTSGSGIKMCGLVSVMGPYNVDTWNNGVMINPPLSANGQWTLTVSSGKRARVQCVE